MAEAEQTKTLPPPSFQQRYINSSLNGTLTSTLPSQQENQKEQYQIPESENIWNAPYLNKTQIFPSYVKILLIIIIGHRPRLSHNANVKRIFNQILPKIMRTQ